MSDRKIRWRCFHCNEGFTVDQEKHARDHFGRDCTAEPVCLIRTAGETALLSALREAEDSLQEYRAEDQKILRSMWSMQSDHGQALIREEEKGYNKGVRDTQDQIAALEAVAAIQAVEAERDALAVRVRELEARSIGRGPKKSKYPLSNYLQELLSALSVDELLGVHDFTHTEVSRRAALEPSQ